MGLSRHVRLKGDRQEEGLEVPRNSDLVTKHWENILKQCFDSMLIFRQVDTHSIIHSGTYRSHTILELRRSENCMEHIEHKHNFFFSS